MRNAPSNACLLSVALLFGVGCGPQDVLESEQLNEVSDALATAGRFETFAGADGQTYFHLRATNGQIVLRSEGYVSRSGATRGVSSVKVNGALPGRYQIVDHADGRAHFVLRAGDGEIIGASEAYASRSNAQRGIDACLELLAGSGNGAEP